VEILNASSMQIFSSPESLNGALETWFIQNNLFPGVPYRVGLNHDFLSKPVVIYLELYQINIDFINRIKKSGCKLVLYHMGAERLDADTSAYSICDLVIRNYYFQNIVGDANLEKKVMWSPNGFRTGVGPRRLSDIRPSVNRQRLAVFLGWLDNASSHQNERKSFARFTNNCIPDLYVLPSNGFSKGFNVGLYSAVMEDSIFAPCPAGNNAETIRLYDALEVGSIPISLTHEFLYSADALALIGPAPFPILNSWEELPAFLNQMREVLKSRPEEISQLQARCLFWWSEYKEAIKAKILNRIQGL
jgi:hypothetical protein